MAWVLVSRFHGVGFHVCVLVSKFGLHRPSRDRPSPGPPKILLFFPSPASISLFLSLWGSSRVFSVVFGRPGRSNVHAWSFRVVVLNFGTLFINLPLIFQMSSMLIKHMLSNPIPEWLPTSNAKPAQRVSGGVAPLEDTVPWPNAHLVLDDPCLQLPIAQTTKHSRSHQLWVPTFFPPAGNSIALGGPLVRRTITVHGAHERRVYCELAPSIEGTNHRPLPIVCCPWQALANPYRA